MSDNIYDEDGFLRARVHPSIEGASTWINSGNMCDSNWSTMEWVPSSGKKLLVMRSRLKVSNDVDLNAKSAVFRALKSGLDGISPNPYWFSRTYANFLDYLLGCDEYFEFTGHREFIWNYDVPIQLKSSESAKIQLDLNNSHWAGTWAYLSIKFISLPEAV